MIFARLFSLLLVLTMVATSGSMAMMRDRSAGGQAVVICNGAGLQTIQVDANGERIELAPICPKCTTAMLAQAPARAIVLRGAAMQVPLVIVRASQHKTHLRRDGVQARAPPIG